MVEKDVEKDITQRRRIMLKYEESIGFLLADISQEAVDFWCNVQGIATMKKDSFVSNFTDYSREGLASILTSIANSIDHKGEMLKAADTRPENECTKPSTFEVQQNDHNAIIHVFDKPK